MHAYFTHSLLSGLICVHAWVRRCFLFVLLCGSHEYGAVNNSRDLPFSRFCVSPISCFRAIQRAATNTKCWMRNSLWFPEFGIWLAAGVFAYGKSCSWFNCGREITKYSICRYIQISQSWNWFTVRKMMSPKCWYPFETHSTTYCCLLLFVGIGSSLCNRGSHRYKQNISEKKSVRNKIWKMRLSRSAALLWC